MRPETLDRRTGSREAVSFLILLAVECAGITIRIGDGSPDTRYSSSC